MRGVGGLPGGGVVASAGVGALRRPLYVTFVIGLVALLFTALAGLLGAPSAEAAKKRPDLKGILSLPGAVQPGPVELTIKVKNRGKRPAKVSHARVLLSADGKRDGKDTKLPGTAKIKKLKPKKAVKRTISTELPERELAGMFLLGCADAKRKLRESNEKNNCAVAAVEVVEETTPEPADSTSDPISPGTSSPTSPGTSDPPPSEPAATHEVLAVESTSVYNGISTPITVWTDELDGGARDVRLTGPSGQVVNPDFSQLGTNEVGVTVPPSLEGGLWDVAVSEEGGGTHKLADVLQIVGATPNLALESVGPAGVSSTISTELTITADDPPPAGQVNFTGTPRAYLSPTGGGAIATPLETSFVSPSQIEAVVAGGLSLGSYDVVVVNPDGSVGILIAAVEVVTALPAVDGIDPQVIANDANCITTDIQITGQNFSAPSVDALAPVGSTPEEIAMNVVHSTSTTITVRFADFCPAIGIYPIRVRNADGGTAFAEERIKIAANNSGHLDSVGWQVSAASMTVPRRAPAVATARDNVLDGHLYAIGGDAGSAGTPLQSVESTPLDPHSRLEGWSQQRYQLPEARTLAGAQRIGEYVYVAGGSNGTSALNSVIRAQVLAPEDAPEVDDHAIVRSTGSPGFAADGAYAYSVAAVFDSDHPDNPDGESLPSAPRTIEVPSAAEIATSLSWTPVSDPDLSGYRVYRAAPGESPDQAQLVGEVGPGITSFTDAAVAPGTARPLPPGSLGQWKPVATLNTAREGAVVLAAPKPDGMGGIDPAKHLLYVIGGGNAYDNATYSGTTATYYDDYEYAEITVGNDGSQTVGSFTSDVTGLTHARYRAAGWAFGPGTGTAPTTYPEPVLFVGAGDGAPPTSTSNSGRSDFEAARVTSTGELDGFYLSTNTAPQATLEPTVIGNHGYLYLFYGRQSASSESSGVLSTASATRFQLCDICASPDLGIAEATSSAFQNRRYLTGVVIDDEMAIVVGGGTGVDADADGTLDPTDTVEFIIR